jgi:hypothetical protein
VYLFFGRSRSRSVGIEPRLRLDDRCRGQVTFLFSIKFRPAVGPTQPSTQWVPWALSPEIERQGREAGHSPPSSAEVKKAGAVPELPIRVHGVVLN